MGTRIALVLGLAAFGLLFTGCGGNSSQAPVAQPTSPTYSMPNTGQDLESALAGLEALPLPDGVDATLWKDLKQAFATALESQQGKTGKFVSSPPTGEQNRVNDLRLVEGAGGSFTLEWSYVNVGDYDQNGEVNVADITPIAINYGATDSSPDWEAKAHFADGDNNNEVNVADITHIAINFQSTINEYQIQTGFTEVDPKNWTG